MTATSPGAALAAGPMLEVCTIYHAVLDADGNLVPDSEGEPQFQAGVASPCSIGQKVVRNIMPSGDVMTDTQTVVRLPVGSAFGIHDRLEYDAAIGPLTGTVAYGRDAYGNVLAIEVTVA